MLFNKKNKTTNIFLLIVTLIYFQNIFSLSLDNILKRPAHQCPAWESLASGLSITNVEVISDHLYKITNKNIFNTWDLIVNHISAASPQEALTKTKNLLNSLPRAQIENKYLQGMSFTYTYELCFYSDDVFMYTMNHNFISGGPITYIS